MNNLTTWQQLEMISKKPDPQKSSKVRLSWLKTSGFNIIKKIHNISLYTFDELPSSHQESELISPNMYFNLILAQ